MQRQYHVGLNSVTKSISQVVDKNRYPTLTHRGPERAWNTGALSAQDLSGRQRLNGDDIQYNIYNNRHKKPPKKPPIPTYASDVSHLVV
jgi:hypothetical protein